ncbi:MAG: TonB-dependent receptor [Gammaproteobacteria bacterium]|jgi:iron complex outermembrane receptor protein|nr:TonB-dependent receptor [Gammaproteobacteria bacterium]
MNKRFAPLLMVAAVQCAQAQLIEEVLVTAQKRAENVMDVPIAITAYTGEALGQLGTRSLSDVGRFTAGVDMNNDKSLQPTYSIRGIETNDWTIGSDPAIAVYVDGVYAARGAGAEAALIDIERIEILKGPQGTLFGRNATGGAIHIITPKPSFETEGEVTLRAGNYDRADAELIYNTPLGESVAMRLSASLRSRDGYMDNLHGDDLNNEDKKNVRVALLWNASDTTEVILRTGYEDMDQESGVLHTTNAAVWEAANPGHKHDNFGDVAYDAPKQQEKRELYTASVEINHEIGDMLFTSITGWREFQTELLEDLDGSNNVDFYFASSNPEDSEFFSQEFRLTGANERVKWTVGAGYTNEKVTHTTDANFMMTTFESFALPPVFDQLGMVILPEEIPAFRASARTGTNPTLNALNPLLNALYGVNCVGQNCDGIAASFFISSLPGVTQTVGELLTALQPRIMAGYADPWTETVDSNGDYTSMAVYGDTTWSLNDRSNLSVGMRYTYDDKTFDLYTAYQNELVPGVPFGIAFFNGGQPLLDETESDNWGSVSGRVVLDYHFTDEVMGYASVATGFKSGGFNSLNFGPDISTSYDSEEVINYELGMKGTVLDGAMQFSSAVFYYDYQNLQTLELIGQPIPSYNLRNADADAYGFETEMAWMINDSWMLAGNYAYLDTEFTKYEIIPAAGETPEDDLTGEPRAESPKHKYNLSLQYSKTLGEMGELQARVDYTWSDDRIDVTRGEVPDYALTNARLSWFSSDTSWELALWGSNLSDEEVLTVFGNGSAVNSTPAWRIPPRMYGVDVAYNF